MLARILVVEDEPDVRLLLRVLLEDEGYQVVEANSGEAAPDSLAHAALAGPQLLTGGGAGPEGGVLTTAAALLFIVLLRLTHATTAADGDAGHAV